MSERGEHHTLHPSLVTSLIEAISFAAAVRPKEVSAALKIQSAYRMWRERQAYNVVRKAVIFMQRVYRGHLQRRYLLALRNSEELAFERAVYDYYATCIQACFRGYYVRCHVDDFYQRRRYVQSTVMASMKVREMAARQAEEQAKMMKETSEKYHEELYKKATAKLNHMISTVHVSGIYRLPNSFTATQTIYGTNVESDIRENARHARRPDHIRTVRERLKTLVKKRTEENENIQKHILGHSINNKDDDNETVGEKKEKEETNKKMDSANMMPFSVLRGAWNKSNAKGCSLPPITNNLSSGTLFKPSGGCVVSHSCIEDYTPLYDTETAVLERCVDAKEIKITHGNKKFVVSRNRRVHV